jgi:hypothetical protein
MLSNVLFILLGAGLVSVGFLAAALAERIRGPRISHERTTRAPAEMTRTPRASTITAVEPAQTPRAPHASIITIEPSEMPRTPTVTRVPRTPRPETKDAPSPGDDVIAALVTAGYKRPVATEATWACSPAERETIEGWTACALRRCARGGLS